jgi:hypothetical protein
MLDNALLTLTIPLSPTGTNHAYAPRLIQTKGRRPRAGMMHTSEHRKWEEATLKAMVEEGTGVAWHVDPATLTRTTTLGLTFDWYLCDHRGDLDSRLKLIQDLVFDYLATLVPKANDRRAWGRHENGHIDRLHPHVVVTLQHLADFNTRYGCACTWEGKEE